MHVLQRSPEVIGTPPGGNQVTPPRGGVFPVSTGSPFEYHPHARSQMCRSLNSHPWQVTLEVPPPPQPLWNKA